MLHAGCMGLQDTWKDEGVVDRKRTLKNAGLGDEMCISVTGRGQGSGTRVFVKSKS
jgi:hypothetical protein